MTILLETGLIVGGLALAALCGFYLWLWMLIVFLVVSSLLLAGKMLGKLAGI